MANPPRKAPGIDLGLVGVLAGLAAIPALIWMLISGLGAGGAVEPAATAPAHHTAEPAERREELERRLERARHELEQARLERIHSPGSSWDDVIAEKQREIADLVEQLAELGRK